jgi:hypothetical protein
MSDNVGLSTPRGSGTSGFVQKSRAYIKPRDSAAPYPKDFDSLKHKQRQPDKGILEHDRKREVEVKVFELRDELEDEGYVAPEAALLRALLNSRDHRVDEDEIEKRCDALRKKLTAEMDRNNGRGTQTPRKGFKMHQVHEQADAKIKESERLRKALKISKDYEEGGHWKRQEERLKKALERDAGEGEDNTEQP